MWMRVDDGLHAHRKTRAVTKAHPVKSRDAAPMGLWVLAGSWAGQNNTNGWVPEDELDRFDSDWKTLAARLVRAGYWWPHRRDGEPGFGFNDWHDYNDPAGAASKAGSFGNHVRWHVNEGRVEPDCQHCPTEPDEQEPPPDDRPDIAPESGGDRGAISHPMGGAIAHPIALPEPEPLPNPTRPEPTTSSDKSDHSLDRFDEFWNAYGNKLGRKKSETAYRAALKKPHVTDDVLILAAAQYADWCRESGTYQKNPLTWLNGEHWNDERAARPQPQSRPDAFLASAQRLHAREQQQQLQIGEVS